MSILWSRWLNRMKQRRGKAAVRKRPRVVPLLEALEDRLVPSSMLTVTTTNDTHAVDAAVSAQDSTGNISLRSAIERADVEGGDTIMTPAGDYKLSLGALSITNSVTIEGAGAATTLVDAQQMDRVLIVTSTATTVTLQDLTLENGKAPTGDALGAGSNDAGGGAILDNGATNLNVTNSVLTNNTAQGADASGYGGAGAGKGGAVYQYGGTLTFTDSTVSGNTAQGGADNTDYGSAAGLGGGVYTILGQLVVQSSTFSGNHAAGGASSELNTAGNGEGGAIDYALTQSGIGLTVTDSTFNGNQAVGGNNTFGGGEGFGGSGFGGAIFDATNASVTDSTIAGNMATAGTGAAANGVGQGGGFYFGGGEGATASIGGTILATNTASTLGQDVYTTDAVNAPFTSLGHNLIGNNDQTPDGFTDGLNGDQVGGTLHGGTIDPMLGLLADNGGPTKTMAITDASPAFEKGSIHDTASFDQRGVSRPIALQSSVVESDVGAYQTEEHLDGGGFNLTLELDPNDSTIVEVFANGVLVDARALSGLDQYHIVDVGTATPPTPPSDFLTVDYGNGFFSLPNGLTFAGDGTSRLIFNDPNAMSGQEYSLFPPVTLPAGGAIKPEAPPLTTASIGRLGSAPISYSGLYLLTVETVAGGVLDIHGTANATLIVATGGNSIIRVAADSGLLGNVLNGPLVVDASGSGNALEVAENNNNPTGDTVTVTSTEIAGTGAAPFQIYYTGSYRVVGLSTGSGADLVTLANAAPITQVGQTIIDAGGGGDTVTVDVSSNSKYVFPYVRGGTSNTGADVLDFVDQTGGATFRTLPLDATHNIEDVSYAGTDVSDIIFSDFGSVHTS